MQIGCKTRDMCILLEISLFYVDSAASFNRKINPAHYSEMFVNLYKIKWHYTKKIFSVVYKVDAIDF
jgi:hypothetical protein